MVKLTVTLEATSIDTYGIQVVYLVYDYAIDPRMHTGNLTLDFL